MSYKTDQAIEKVTKEALALKNNFATFIEEHLTEICVNDTVAEKLLTGKPLKDFCKNCQDEARKKARSQGSGFQVAGFPDQEYFEMVEKFYGITEEDKTPQHQATPAGNVINIMDFL